MISVDVVNPAVLCSGVYYDLSMDEYLAHPAISSSQLKKILDSPRDFQASLRQKSKDTPETILGTAIHAAILEPHAFDDRYALQPEDWGPLNKGEGAKLWNAFKKDNAGKIFVTIEDADKIRQVIEACNKHKSLRAITSACKTEVTAVCNYRGHSLKARADCLTDEGFLWDVKSTSKKVDDNNLGKTVYFNGYHFQAAHHTLVFREAGVDVQGFGWIFISTKTPAVHIITRKASIDVIEAGAYDHTFALETLKLCEATNHWYGFDDDIKELKFPEFVERNYDELHTSKTFTSSRASYLAI